MRTWLMYSSALFLSFSSGCIYKLALSGRRRGADHVRMYTAVYTAMYARPGLAGRVSDVLHDAVCNTVREGVREAPHDECVMQYVM